MSSWKTKLIQAYRFCSLPYRKVRWANMSRNAKVPVLSVFYHRVADQYPNDWTISTHGFEQQINWFERNFDLVSLEEAQNRIRSGANNRPTLTITFDDGYAENSEFALPFLLERKIPVTYFVTVDNTFNQRAFPHDIERGCPLPTNSVDSLIAMSAAGIELGAHTRTHVDLGKVTDERELVDEVITSSLELEAVVGRKVRYFAFPYGLHRNINPKSCSMLRDAGFLGVCSAYGGWNHIGGDAFHLRRFHGDPNLERVKNWLSYDPRMSDLPDPQPFFADYDQEIFEEAIKAAKSRPRATFPADVMPNTTSDFSATTPEVTQGLG